MGSLHKKVIERPAGCITFKILFFVLVKGRSPSTATVGGANMHPDQSWIRLVAPEPFDRLHGSSCSSFYPFFMDGGVLSTLMIVLEANAAPSMTAKRGSSLLITCCSVSCIGILPSDVLSYSFSTLL